MERKFSIIIPTLFKCVDILNDLLDVLNEDISVSEIILIDNTDKEVVYKDILRLNNKIRIYSENKNLYVNPSWNLGVRLAQEDYIGILNDDIIVPDNIFTTLSSVNLEGMGIIGAFNWAISKVDNPKRFQLPKATLWITPHRVSGYGIFMVMSKDNYIDIPEDMLIWCGDDYLFHQNIKAGRTNYALEGKIETRMSATSDNPEFDEIKNKDVEVYESKYKIDIMTLVEVFNMQEPKTDKGTTHDYIAGYYANEFAGKRDQKISLMEIGVHRGPSIKLWKEWFRNSEIVGVDNENMYEGNPMYDRLLIADGYTDEFINGFEDNYFDYIIDDGPHTLESQLISITKWIHKVKPGGKLIVEDIQSYEWIEVFEKSLDKSIVSGYRVIDLRGNKRRYDDVIFEVCKK